MIWHYGQVAVLSFSHRLPSAIKAQQLKILLLQTLSPCLRVLSCGEKGGLATADSFGQSVLTERDETDYSLREYETQRNETIKLLK
jgi:hypothetical protein